MTVFIVEEWLNDYPENGGGFQCIEGVYSNEETAKEKCYRGCLFEDEPLEDGEIYYEYHAYQVED